MDRKEEKGSSEPKPRYVWDPKKLAWIETTEAALEEPAAEKAAAEPKHEEGSKEAIVEPKAEEVSPEVPEEGAPVEKAVEAVGPQYKGAWARLLGIIIDGLVMGLISIAFSRAFGSGTSAGNLVSTSNTPVSWAILGVVVVYLVGLGAWRGQTLGKMVIGAKIVKTDGKPIGVGRALLRFVGYLIYFVIIYLLKASIIGVLVALFIALMIIGTNKKKRGLHDFIAGTVVINSRPKKPEPVAVAEPVDATEATETAESPVTSEPETDKPEQDK
jgi:uncharacterized RDD family membrane protein YckC